MKKKVEEKEFYTSEEMKEIFAEKESFWDSIKYFPWRLGFKIKNLYYQVKYGFQRMFRGYDDTELFNMDMTFIDRYSKILKDFREYHHGHPYVLTSERWDTLLDEMLKHLLLMNENNVIAELKNGMPDSFEPSYKTVNEIQDKHKEEFFKLFSEWFYSLWD